MGIGGEVRPGGATTLIAFSSGVRRATEQPSVGEFRRRVGKAKSPFCGPRGATLGGAPAPVERIAAVVTLAGDALWHVIER